VTGLALFLARIAFGNVNSAKAVHRYRSLNYRLICVSPTTSETHEKRGGVLQLRRLAFRAGPLSLNAPARRRRSAVTAAAAFGAQFSGGRLREHLPDA